MTKKRLFHRDKTKRKISSILLTIGALFLIILTLSLFEYSGWWFRILEVLIVLLGIRYLLNEKRCNFDSIESDNNKLILRNRKHQKPKFVSEIADICWSEKNKQEIRIQAKGASKYYVLRKHEWSSDYILFREFLEENISTGKKININRNRAFSFVLDALDLVSDQIRN